MTEDRQGTFVRWLPGIELGIIVITVAASIVSGRALLPGVILAAAVWPARWLATGRPTVRTPGDWAIVLLLIMLPVTLWATALPEVTRPEVLRLLMGIALYYAIANGAGTIARLRLVAAGLIAAGLALALLAPFLGGLPAASKVSFVPMLAARLPQLLADTINANVAAGALAPLLPLALALPIYAWPRLRWFERALAIIAGLAMLGALVLTQSRGAWLAAAAALLVLIALRWQWGWLSLPLAALGGGAAIWRMGLPRTAEALVATQALGGAEQRLEIWSRALYALQDFPFTGIGMGMFRQVANLLYPLFLAGPDAEIPHAHNLFLQVGVDLGLPGLVAWLALFLLVSWSAWRVYRWGRSGKGGGEPHPYLSALGAGLLASQIALAVHGLTDAATWGTRPAVLVWGVWGLAMAARNLTITEPGHEER